MPFKSLEFVLKYYTMELNDDTTNFTAIMWQCHTGMGIVQISVNDFLMAEVQGMVEWMWNTQSKDLQWQNIWKTIKAAMQQLHSSYSEYFVMIVLSSVTHWHALKKKKGPVFLCPGVQRF